MSKRLPDTDTWIDTQLREGRRKFAKQFTHFMGTASSTELMKLADEVCGKRYIHSSFIQNLQKGAIKDPNHAALVALGDVNLHIYAEKIPKFNPMFESDGTPIAQDSIHLAFLGLLDLQELPETLDPWPSPSEELLALSELGKSARTRLAQLNIDWFSELDEMHPDIKALLTNSRHQSLRQLLDNPASLTEVLQWDRETVLHIARSAIGREES